MLSIIKRFQNNGYSDVNRVFAYCNIFFGDPLLDLKLPKKPNLSISQSDIHFLNTSPTSQDDYIPLKIYYHNYGLVPDDSVRISIEDKVNNVLTFYQDNNVPVPLFTDSLSVNIPIKNLSGEHDITVVLDSANHLDEIYKNDNRAESAINVYSISFKNLADDKYYNISTGNITLLNPSFNQGTQSGQYMLQIDTSQNFINPMKYEGAIGTFATTIPIKEIKKNVRYWWRIKLSSSSIWSKSFSFISNGTDYNWFIDKPIDNSSDIELDNAHYDFNKNAWTLSEKSTELKIESAGFNDGELASIQYNLNESLPSTYFWGIVTATIDTITLQPRNIKYFLYPNPPSGDSLLSYLKSLPEGTVLAISVCDDAAQSVIGYNAGTPVRNELKNWGSKYIDSVKYRESWCMLGKKGAPIGSVPEVYKKQFQGIAIIDTTKEIKHSAGNIIMPLVENSAEWDSIKINSVVPNGSSVKVVPLGIKENGETDTLNTVTFNNGAASIKNINAEIYHKLKFLIKMNANISGISPEVKSLALKYKMLPELGTNYQVVSISNDSLTVGQNEQLKFYVYNYGGVPADSFNVKVELVNFE